MLKLVLIVLAVVLLAWLLFGRASRKPPPGASRKAHGGAEGMVACAHCGVHLPRSESLTARALHYCSAAHRDAGPSA